MVADYYEVTSPRKYQTHVIPSIDVPKTRTTTHIKSTSKDTAKSTKKAILFVIVFFVALLTISYRYSVINSAFSEKEKLKKQLTEITKQNEQLQVGIEQQMNYDLIEKEAKQRLGMQKLDNSQKIYINLEKEDYIESSSNSKSNENKKSWWSKLISDLFKSK